jgi:hypothetical protein
MHCAHPSALLAPPLRAMQQARVAHATTRAHGPCLHRARVHAAPGSSSGNDRASRGGGTPVITAPDGTRVQAPNPDFKRADPFLINEARSCCLCDSLHMFLACALLRARGPLPHQPGALSRQHRPRILRVWVRIRGALPQRRGDRGHTARSLSVAEQTALANACHTVADQAHGDHAGELPLAVRRDPRPNLSVL